MIACGVGLAVGQTTVDRLDAHATVKALVTVVLFGLALVVVGLLARGAPARSKERGSRSATILAGLHNVGPAATFSMDGLLGFGGRSQSWPAEHGGVLRVWLALGIGSALVADGLLRLLV